MPGIPASARIEWGWYCNIVCFSLILTSELFEVT